MEHLRKKTKEKKGRHSGRRGRNDSIEQVTQQKRSAPLSPEKGQKLEKKMIHFSRKRLLFLRRGEDASLHSFGRNN